MKLRLNLSTAPRENKRPFLAGSLSLAAVALIALVLLSHSAYRAWQSNRELRREVAQWQAEIRSSRQKQADLEAYFRSPQARQQLDRAAFLNSLIGERSFPWTKVFMDLEQTLPPGVRVVNIAPQMKDGRVELKLTVGAVSDETKIKFLEALEKSKAFSDIQVQDDKHSDQLSSADRVQIVLTASYVTT
jgi:Tfp pilus assembly protein PilN